MEIPLWRFCFLLYRQIYVYLLSLIYQNHFNSILTNFRENRKFVILYSYTVPDTLTLLFWEIFKNSLLQRLNSEICLSVTICFRVTLRHQALYDKMLNVAEIYILKINITSPKVRWVNPVVELIVSQNSKLYDVCGIKLFPLIQYFHSR